MGRATLAGAACCFSLAVFLQGCGRKQSVEQHHLRPTPKPNITDVGPPHNQPNLAGCTPKGGDCSRTGCCKELGHGCYRKDKFFASCRSECTPGIWLGDPAGFRTPWSCEKVPNKLHPGHIVPPAPPAPVQGLDTCVAEFQNCKTKPCCGGLTCYEKDNVWWGCKKACTPGVDPTDPPHYRTPWTCKLKRAPEPVAVAPIVPLAPGSKPAIGAPAGAFVAPPVPPPVQHCPGNKAGKEGYMAVAGLEGATYALGGGGTVANGALTLNHNSGYSLMTTCREEWAPEEFVQLKLTGHTITFRVDLSKVGCACNLAFYLVGGPAIDPAGQPSKGTCKSSPYYCDANKVCGQWCPEIDIMEANTHAFQSTPHKCDNPTPSGHYPSCDRNGCAQNTRDMPGAYGPGAAFKIDTTKPFNVSTQFSGQMGGTLTGFITYLRQEGREVVMNHPTCDPGYLGALTAALQTGMSLRMTYWGSAASTMGWMDKPPCGEETCSAANAGPGVISGVMIDPPQPGPPTRQIQGLKPLPPPGSDSEDVPAPPLVPLWQQPQGPPKHCPGNKEGKEGLMTVAGLEGAAYALGGGGEVSDGALKLHHNSGYSLMTTCREEWAPDEFVQLKLTGHTITFRVDLSKVGCACNLAFYLVGGPALDPAGVPSKGTCKSSPYYCDANKVCGQWCPEIDIMEANTHAFQSTPHKCDNPTPSGHYPSCDRSGCAQNTRDMAGAYGPGAGFKIDTTKPFNVSTQFSGQQGGALTGFITFLRQEGREVVMNHPTCNPAYLGQLTAALQTGMSLRMTYWGSAAATMGWMDKPPCGEETCSAANAGPGVISGVMIDPPQPGPPIRKIPGVKPLPPPVPVPTLSPTQPPIGELDPVPNVPVTSAAPSAASGVMSKGWILIAVGLACVGIYVGCIVLLWAFPALGPKLACKERCFGAMHRQPPPAPVDDRPIPAFARFFTAPQLSNPPVPIEERPVAPAPTTPSRAHLFEAHGVMESSPEQPKTMCRGAASNSVTEFFLSLFRCSGTNTKRPDM